MGRSLQADHLRKQIARGQQHNLAADEVLSQEE
jgi:hypothetical protein